MVKITIRLVGEENDRLFQFIELDPQSHVDGLVKRIEKVTRIPGDYQQIQFRGEEIPQVEHPLESIKFGEELVVKHADLPWWMEYKECVEMVLNHCADQVAIAEKAVEHHERLSNSGFFKVYVQFAKFQRLNHIKVAVCTDSDVKLIRKATEQYFHNLHDQTRGNEDSKFTCYFETRDADLGGRPTNTLAFVQIHGEDSVSKYNIKCQHHGSPGSGQVPDVSELYCYKLLSLIGVGPKSHIIPSAISTSTYIATQWDERFELLENVIDENNLSTDVVVQLVMLRLLLFITDLHEHNCGRWRGTQEAAIVDFAMTEDIMIHPDIKDELTSTVPNHEWKKQYNAVRNLHDDNSWLKIAKVYFNKWNISDNIELALEQFDPTKDLLKRLENGYTKRKYRLSPTDRLNEYIDTLKINLENLQNLMNSVV